VTEPIALNSVLARIDQLWSPRVVARVNDYDVRIAKVGGAYTWHVHADTDEFFLVLDGILHLALREDTAGGRVERAVVLGPGEVYVVPAGTGHRPSAPDGASILMFEPAGTAPAGSVSAAAPSRADRGPR
jgi:mannose-6-phosphate isomerase-like protein (cupin superfamily)